MFYWYAKFCRNILVTDDTGNAQSLESACLTSNSFFPISFLMRNGKLKGIQLKSYCRYPYDSFCTLKKHNMYFKTVHGSDDVRVTSLPKVMKKNKISPPPPLKKAFFLRCRILKIVPCIEQRRDGFGGRIYKPFPKTKTKIRRLVESRIVKNKKCFTPKRQNNVI